jgi:hypothetical protein
VRAAGPANDESAAAAVPGEARPIGAWLGALAVEADATPPAAQPEAAAQPGLPAIDVLRFVSVCAIVWFHVDGGGRLFTFRLPAIALITCFVQSRSRFWRPGGVLIPWLFWYGCYLALFAGRYVLKGPMVADGLQLMAQGSWWNPLVGPAWHLWYGPFALAAALVVHRWRLASHGAVLGAAAVSFAISYLLVEAPFPYNRWAQVLPAMSVGMLLARGCASSVAGMALLAAMGGVALGLPYVLAIVLVSVSSRWTGRRLKNLATFSRGVYWSHLIVIDLAFSLGFRHELHALLGTFVLAALLMVSARTRRLV